MLIFNSAYIIIGLFTSLFFDTPSLGLACGLILWTVSLLGPFLSLEWSARTVSAYISTKSSSKLSASVIPIHGLYFFFRIVEFYESYDVPFGWPAIYRKALGRDNVTPFTLMLCMGASAFVFSLGIWYLEAVLPWTNVVPLPLHFPFMASYWNVVVEEVKVAGSQESSNSQEEGHENFEEEPRHLLLVLEVIDLCKVYRKKFAVDHLNMRLYYGQIFVLLGHNGAGKSTICNMLSGLLRPTYGTAIIEGFDLIKNHDDALENVRVCPQRNMLYDELTVYEHLYFFAIIQRISTDTIAEQVEIIIKSLHFGPHINSFPRALPQGFRRKLCIAITVIADPKVLILDEPTAGLDPQSRNEVWDLLQKMRRTCTMLLTTHDMEEADVVGDRIAILAEGTIRCCGSSQFLKHRFGTGYHLDIVKRPRRCDVGGVIMVVKTYVPTVQLVSESTEILRLSLGVTSSEGFVDMFKVLERFRKKLGVAMMSVSVTTMEDVYLRHSPFGIRKSHKTTISAPPDQTQEPVDIKALREKCEGCVWRKSSLQALLALLRKRIQFARHQWMLPVLGIVAPALLLALQGIRERGKATTTEVVKDVYPYDLKVMYNFSIASVITADEESVLVSQYYRQYLEQKGLPCARVRDITDYLLEVGSRSMEEYAQHAVGGSFFLIGKKAQGSKTQAGESYSGELYHSAIIALNLVHTSLLRWTVGDDTASIKLRVRPQKQLEEAIAYDPDSPDVIQRHLERFTLGAMSVAMMTAACGLFPVVDRRSGFRQLQMLTGLPLRIYWLANFMFDLFVYLLSCGSFFSAMFYYYGTFFIEMMTLIVFIFVCYGFCAVPMSYLLTLAADTPTTGYALVLLASFFGAFMQSGTIAFGLLRAAAGVRFVLLNVLPVLRLMPSYALMSAIGKTVSKSQIAYICSRGTVDSYRRICVEPVGGFSVAAQEERTNNEDFVEYCCPQFLALGATRLPDYTPSISDVPEAFFMLFEGMAFALLLLYLDGGGIDHIRELFAPQASAGRKAVFSQKGPDRVVPDHKVRDDDVEAEESRVRNEVLIGKLGKDVLAVLEFCKTLALFARLRGVPEYRVASVTGDIARLVGLETVIEEYVAAYSAGMRRRLSVAVALVGLPPLVLLDEPTVGVDVSSRRIFWDALRGLQNVAGISVVITTGSMEEVEVVCDRLAIMIDGEFQCMGSLSHLKGKFAQGFTIMVKTHDEYKEDYEYRNKLMRAISETFLNSKLQQQFEGFLEYHMANTGLLWSDLFAHAEAIKQKYNVLELLISDTTLDHVYAALARWERGRPHRMGDADSGEKEEKDEKQ
ncbi:hypothetical protein HPB52_025062 [Rhipicephalus sanguineus]|uniref:ABC transporter domain-containing protein n=1 Tax=Rhipicephalus sanguineus TaxID=34632 RepID=A0A9D4TDH9_RHISA|nr:hypothetical protein HPB52_025062 [Rhipicephalus sanguineus]